ncbi:8792_t:CDS:2 [Entrophospora sp. SA101]|nr:10131_t:CDS:2 [Entrophospora sp. SA101]CAJ0760443.1 8792_t:CDS:2 [Entrophospora sp. SA101]CAJ0828298.1 12469_t:CDS:2 [Entrophospora sp. SA101]CAJ0878309.1 8739_t:CDS:2 [Entrophospora sp. SA101]
MKGMAKVSKSLKPLEFRRSVTKEKISTPVAIPNKESVPSILPPKKVIKALYDYEAQAPHELSFSKGDFFHVIGNENDPNWYEACNPATNVQGFAPVSYFQILEKSNRMSEDKGSTAIIQDINKPGTKPQPLYGIVLYDFFAERPDELDAKAGEPIIVIAQSNHEWFVAKPIGRLGGPGLIPVSFIEIRDHATGKAVENVQELMDKSIVPKVEEWKKMTKDYQANSISLGRLDFPKLAPYNMDNSNSDDDNNRKSDSSSTLPTSPIRQREDTPSVYSNRKDNNANDEMVSASIESFHFENGKYWFLIRVELSSRRFRILYRIYEDFYDFQIALLNKYPEEAGRTGKKRILPFMPGPLTYVDDRITQQRRNDLDIYVKELITLPPKILKDPLLDQLFGIKKGDIETRNDPRQPDAAADVKGSPLTDADNSPIDPIVPISSSSYTHNNSDSQTSLPLTAINYKSLQSPSKHHHNSNSSTYSNINFGINNTNSLSSSTLMKIKILYKDDLIAIRVPSNITYVQLREKLNERLGEHVMTLTYKDDNTGHVQKLDGDDDLNHAIVTCPKLMIFVE